MSSPSSIDLARPGTASWRRCGFVSSRTSSFRITLSRLYCQSASCILGNDGEGEWSTLWNTLSKAAAGRESAAYIVGTFDKGAPGNGLKRAPSSSTPLLLPVLGLKESAGY